MCCKPRLGLTYSKAVQNVNLGGFKSKDHDLPWGRTPQGGPTPAVFALKKNRKYEHLVFFSVKMLQGGSGIGVSQGLDDPKGWVDLVKLLRFYLRGLKASVKSPLLGCEEHCKRL
jgi:hypothetical protein